MLVLLRVFHEAAFSWEVGQGLNTQAGPLVLPQSRLCFLKAWRLGSRQTKQKRKVGSWKFENVTSSSFFWHKQVPNPAQIQGEGNSLLLLMQGVALMFKGGAAGFRDCLGLLALLYSTGNEDLEGLSKGTEEEGGETRMSALHSLIPSSVFFVSW